MKFDFAKNLFFTQVKITVFFHYLLELLRGKLRPKLFFPFLKRLLSFLKRMDHNKLTKLSGGTRFNLYVPTFPTKSFYTACNKFSVFDAQLPCTTMLLSLTKACRYRCEHCYQRHDEGEDVSIELLIPVVKELQEMGIAFFNIEGGEPFLRYDRLLKICHQIDDRSEIWINSTGDGVTAEKLIALNSKNKNIIALMFSLHSANEERFNRFFKSENAWSVMNRAIEACHQVEIAVAFNVCLERESFYDGTFEAILEFAKEKGGSVLQLIHPKAAGAKLINGFGTFTDADLSVIKKKVHTYNLDKNYRDYPAISAQIIEEEPGQFGCTAGGTDRFYINAKGDVEPCEFLNISFGNIKEEPFGKIYERMRDGFNPPGESWLCEKYCGEVARIAAKHSPYVLPISKGETLDLTKDWDRGKPTELYR